tara:strand:- start:470 stop:913 length:444 start_codon:yes stop_codon:yes gene_type:complete
MGRYLAKTMLSACCNKCDDVHACNQRHDWDEDAMSDYDISRCPNCNWASYHLVDEEDEVAAKWWSVGLYQIYQAYGGPEEGGWHYQTGNMEYPFKQRIFEVYEEAQTYLQKLRDECEAGEWGRDIQPTGFTDCVPVAGWPNSRPYYS